MKHEQTLRAAVGCKGIGLHSGAPVNLRILPAPSGSGIIFRRTDLDDFEIEAGSRNVARVSYATSLMKKGVLISTTEHLLSAFIGAGIDNAIVELDNLELPILDGSARPFVEMIHRAGIRKQRRERTYLRIRREFELREGDKFIAVYPARHLFGFLHHQLPAPDDRQGRIPRRPLRRKLLWKTLRPRAPSASFTKPTCSASKALSAALRPTMPSCSPATAS